MKPLILLLAAVLCMFSVNAQTFNIQAGTTISNLDWKINKEQAIYFQNTTGYAFFVGMDYLDKKYINLSSNIGLIRKGGLMDIPRNWEDSGEYGSATLDYFSLNTLIELKCPINEKIIPFISVGPRMDLLINSSRQFEYFRIEDQLSKLVFGLVAGAGLKYNYSKSVIAIRFDHYTDFSNVSNHMLDVNAGDTAINVNMFSLNVSYGYKF